MLVQAWSIQQVSVLVVCRSKCGPIHRYRFWSKRGPFDKYRCWWCVGPSMVHSTSVGFGGVVSWSKSGPFDKYRCWWCVGPSVVHSTSVGVGGVVSWSKSGPFDKYRCWSKRGPFKKCRCWSVVRCAGPVVVRLYKRRCRPPVTWYITWHQRRTSKSKHKKVQENAYLLRHGHTITLLCLDLVLQRWLSFCFRFL